MTHIVDALIEERATRWRRRPRLWRHVRRWLKPILLYDTARQMADHIAPLSGAETLAYMQETLALDVAVSGLEHVPKRGLAVATANHPAGIADGIAVFDALSKVREDITFFANRDAVRVCPGLADCIVPVEWREAERTRAKARQTLRDIRRAFASKRLVVVFPSGRLARPTPIGLWERPWQSTALALAQKHHAPILPLHLKGHNSALYYLLWFVSRELKDMTLFREIINKRHGRYRIAIGEPFPPTGDPVQLAEALRRFVTRDMRRGRTRFAMRPGAARSATTWSRQRRRGPTPARTAPE